MLFHTFSRLILLGGYKTHIGVLLSHWNVLRPTSTEKKHGASAENKEKTCSPRCWPPSEVLNLHLVVRKTVKTQIWRNKLLYLLG